MYFKDDGNDMFIDLDSNISVESEKGGKQVVAKTVIWKARLDLYGREIPEYFEK